MAHAFGLLYDGENVTQVRLERTMSPDEFMETLQTANSTNGRRGVFPLVAMPSNTRFAVFDSTLVNGEIVIEVRPGIFPLRFHSARRSFKLMMPWQYFIFSVKKTGRTAYSADGWTIDLIRLAWSPVRINRTGDVVYRPFVPNTDDTNYICMGNTVPPSEKSLQDRIEDVVENFYSDSSVFNSDLNWLFPDQFDIDTEDGDEDSIVSGFRAWENASKTDPTMYRTWTYENARVLADMLSENIEYDENGDTNRRMAPRTAQETLDLSIYNIRRNGIGAAIY